MISSKLPWVLVTGAACRLGRSMALHLADLGYPVALHYNRSRVQAEETALLIRSKGVECFLFSCDLSDATAAENLIPEVLRQCPSLAVVINNASVFEKAGLKSGDAALFDQHWRINLQAPYILTRQFALLCGRGQVINILDAAIAKNRITHLPYLITKKALAALTELAAVELAPDIRVNGVAPGVILPPSAEGEDYVQRRAQQIPMKQKGTPQQVNQALQFLLEHPYITGQVIFVDGGEHL